MIYKDLNENNKLKFEEQRMRHLLSNAEMDQEEQIKLLSESFKKISDYTLLTLAKNIASIRTPEATVTEEGFILDFLKQAETSVYNKIKAAIIGQKSKEELKPLKITCQAELEDKTICGHEYDQPFTLDMTSFFDQD
jgi:F0F1-type ATP synthase delta subunit